MLYLQQRLPVLAANNLPHKRRKYEISVYFISSDTAKCLRFALHSAHVELWHHKDMKRAPLPLSTRWTTIRKETSRTGWKPFYISFRFLIITKSFPDCKTINLFLWITYQTTISRAERDPIGTGWPFLVAVVPGGLADRPFAIIFINNRIVSWYSKAKRRKELNECVLGGVWLAGGCKRGNEGKSCIWKVYEAILSRLQLMYLCNFAHLKKKYF